MNSINILENMVIQEIYALVYIEYGMTEYSYSDVVKYQFVFENLSCCIECDESGGGLIYSFNKELVEINMEEQGSLAKISLKGHPLYNTTVGEKVKAVKVILFENNNVGFSLILEDSKIILMNLGDEIYFSDNISDELLNEGYTEVDLSL